MSTMSRVHRGRVRILVATGTVLAGLLGPVAVPARADSIDQKRAQAAAIADQLDALTERMDALGEDYSQSLSDQATIGEEIKTATQDVARAEAQVAQMRGTLYASAVNQFMQGGRGNTLGNLLARIGGLQDSLQRQQLTSIALNQGALTTDSLDAVAGELAKKRRALERKKKQAEAVAANVLRRRGATEDMMKRYEALQASVKGDLVQLLAEERARRDKAALDEARNIANSWSGKYASTQARYRNLPKVSARSQVAINAALKQLGTPYRYAMSSPGVAFDCSGLTTYAWGKAGVGLPRNSRAQYNALPRIPKSMAMPGDLIFTGSPIHHVGIYLGGGTMVHAPQYGDVVKVSPVRWFKVVGVVRPG